MISRNKNFSLFENSPDLFNERRLEKRMSHIIDLIDDRSEIEIIETEKSKYRLTIISPCLCRSVFYLGEEEIKNLESRIPDKLTKRNS